MRVLITAVPIHGHLLPLFPLARAVAEAGDRVAVAAPASMTGLAGGLPVLPTGPDITVLLAENARRTAGADLSDMRDVSPVASLFAGVRVDLTYDDALARAGEFGPDVIVADEYDAVAPLVAAALRVPLVRHAIGLPVSPPELVPAMAAMLAPRRAERGLTRADRVALVDPWPAALQTPGWSPAADRFPIRPAPYAGTTPPDPIPAARGRRVLVTLGTVLRDGEMLDALVEAVAAVDDVDVLATIPPGVEHPVGETRPGVRFVGFVPMARLLATGVAAVVAAGGAGTVLAAMSHGIPMVLWPKGAEKPMNAERVEAAGAGLTIDDPAGAAAAVHEVLTDPSYATAAGRVAAQIADAPDATRVWSALRRKLLG